MKSFLNDLFASEDGATAIEYALIASLIAVAVVAGAAMLGISLTQLFNDIAFCVSIPANCLPP